MAAKNQSYIGQNIEVQLEDLTEFFQEIVSLVGFGVTVCEMSMSYCWGTKRKYGNSVLSSVDMLMVAQNPIIHSILWKC